MPRRTKKSRAKPVELQLPRGPKPKPGSAKYDEYMAIQSRIEELRATRIQNVSAGIPVVRRGKPPADPEERRVWQANNELAREFRKSGIALVPGKTPRSLTSVPIVEETTETDKEILDRHMEAFKNMHELCTSVAMGKLRALIITGAPGIGKTVTATDVLNAFKTKNKLRYKKLAGRVSPVAAYKAAYQYRGPNDVLLFDDADGLFFAEDGLNLLKALLDTLEKREPTWNTNTMLVGEDGDEIPRSGWVFEGSVIFISNLDFDRLTSGPPSRISDHLKAVINRAFTFDLRIHTPREAYIWTKYVVETKNILQSRYGLSKAQEQQSLNWLKAHLSKLREVSLRSALTVAFLIANHTKNWESLAKAGLYRKRNEPDYVAKLLEK
jgi:hypothetical protein